MPKPIGGERWYSRTEACQALNVSMSTLERALRDREIRFTKRGWRVYISQAEIDRYITQHARPDWVQPALPGLESLDRPRLMSDVDVDRAAAAYGRLSRGDPAA